MYLDGSLESFLNIESFAHDGLVKLPLKRQQVHVRLRLRNKFSDLKSSQRENQHDLKQLFKPHRAVLSQSATL